MPPPVVLTIAGFDPSAGAGVLADIKTIAAHGCYGVACPTALTVQSTAGVKRVEAVPLRTVKETLAELAADVEIAAVHIGMLGTEAIARAVATFLPHLRCPHVVLDPVLKSSSGSDLIDPKGVKVLVGKLIPLAGIVTPNVDEAYTLAGVRVRNLAGMRAAAARLHEMGATAVVITGGHLDPARDLLSWPGTGGYQEAIFESEHLTSKSTHGTGCAFSTAVACQLALGKGILEAVRLAKEYVTEAIAKAYPVGRGTGPINHLYRMEKPSGGK